MLIIDYWREPVNTANRSQISKTIVDFSEPVVVYDGNCNLCLFWLDVLLKSQPNPPFQLVSVTDLTPQEKTQLNIQKASDFHSVIYSKSNALFLKSDAIIEIGKDLGGRWALLKWLKWMPKSIRDWAYGTVAANRYKWFGKKETCVDEKCTM